MIPSIHVLLNKIDFEASPQANRGEAFVCHVVVAYSSDLCDRLQGMDSRGYFTTAESLRKTYKDSIEIFRFDIIPGRNRLNQKINIRSRFKAKGAFIFAKYSASGKFMESVGMSKHLVVRFQPYNMEVISDMSFDKLKEKINLGGIGNIGGILQ
jgi:hypothetical protein